MYGWIAGVVYYLAILPWMLTLWDWAGWAIVLGYFSLCCVLAIIWGVWSWSLGFWQKKSLLLIVGGTVVWVSLEYFRTLGPLGFAWGLFGYGMVDLHPLDQIASVTSVLGLSFLAVMTNLAIWCTIDTRNFRYIVSAVGIVIGFFVLGGWQAERWSDRIAQAPSLRLAMVQPNLTQTEKSDPSRININLEKYLKLMALIEPPVDLVVLPESILPTLVLEDPDTLEPILRQARSLDAGLMMGTFTRESQNLFNSAVLYSNNGMLVGQYDKVQLVPFSTEYFPFIQTLKNLGLERWLGPLPLGAVSPGRGHEPLVWEHVAIGSPICFESTFGSISRAFANRGANLLITITNDAWFKQSIALDQHFAMGQMRAVESGLAFVQLANTGKTGAVLPDGTQLMAYPKHTDGVSYVNVPLLEYSTVYRTFGDWFAWINVILLGGLTVLTRRFR